MRLRIVPARQGAAWVRNGFALFFAHPLAFTLLFACFLFGMLLLMMLPLVGSLLLLMALPLVSLGFMIAGERARRGLGSSVKVFVEPLAQAGPRRTALLRLSATYAAATAVVMLLSSLADGGSFEALREALSAEKVDARVVAERLVDGRLMLGVSLRLLLAGLLAVPFWHAPALVYWGGVSFAKSLFFSTVACWRNGRAFMIYALSWLGLMMLFSLLLQLVAALLGEPRLVIMAAMPAGLLFSTVFYVSLYDTFADSFEVAPEAQAITA